MSLSCRHKPQRDPEPPVHTPGDGWFVLSFLLGIVVLTGALLKGCP